MAYSYLRFSTSEQALGDSERRQIAEAQAWADEKKLTLDTSFRDKGASGFKGVHRKKGALGEFLRQVHTEEIPSGSYLVVEDLDRLSREHPLDAITPLVTLLHSGIVIVVLKTKEEYSATSLRSDVSGIKMMGLTFELGRASGESARKAILSKANWNQKLRLAIESGKVLTAQTPAWIKVVKNEDGSKKFVLDAERVSLVRDIFKWTIAGMGNRLIAQKLNEARIANWGKGKRAATHWHNSYIQKILNSRTVLGDFEPHEYQWVEDGKDGRKQVRVPRGEPLKNYYPRAIDDETFERANEARKKRGQYGGKLTHSVGNLLSGLVHARIFDPLLRAEKPQGKFHEWTELVPCLYRNKGKAREVYYVGRVDPVNKPRPKKDWIKSESIPVYAVEYGILKTFEEINWREIANSASISLVSEQEECKRLWELVEENKKQCDRYVRAIGNSDDDDEGLLRAYRECQQLRKDLLKKAEKKEAALKSKMAVSDEDLGSPLAIPKSAYDPTDRDNRLMLRAEIARRVKAIELVLAPLPAGKLQPKRILITIVFRNLAKRLIIVELKKNQMPELVKVNILPRNPVS